MATAFSKAALAEAKRVLDAAQAELDEILDTEGRAIHQYRVAADSVTEATKEVDRLRVAVRNQKSLLKKAQTDYDQMLALSKQG